MPFSTEPCEDPVAAFAKTRFALCHAGARQNGQAIKLAGHSPDVRLDIHGQGVARLRTLIQAVGAARLMYGSGWAIYPEALILVRMLLATEKGLTVRRMLFAEKPDASGASAANRLPAIIGVGLP